MADRIIKSDSGNDTVIQNNSGSRKIEVTNSGDVEVTGDLKATTVKATNLKANDGTAALVIADSTGQVTSSGKIDLNGNELILDADADSSITADTDDQIDFKTAGSDRLVINSGGDVYSEPATTETWAVSGISSLTQDSNFYKRIGKMVFISGRLYGPGNSTSFSVTNLPYAGKSSTTQSISVSLGRDNGSFNSETTASVSGSTLTFFKSSSATAFSSGTGDRRAFFSGWYEAETV